MIYTTACIISDLITADHACLGGSTTSRSAVVIGEEGYELHHICGEITFPSQRWCSDKNVGSQLLFNLQSASVSHLFPRSQRHLGISRSTL